MVNKIHALSKPLISIIGVIGLWFYVSSHPNVSNFVLPTPQHVWTTFTNMFGSNELTLAILISLKRVFIGFICASILAFISAFIFYLLPKLHGYCSFLIEFLRNIPPLALIPLLILWLGIGEETKIVLIILAAYFPIFLNIEKGFQSCDKDLIEVGQSMKFSSFEIFYKIVLPSSLKDILVGMRVGLGLSWRSIIAAEMIAASSGLGYMILFAQQMSRTDRVIIGIIIIGLIGFLCDYLFKLLIRYLVKTEVDYV